MFRRHRHIEAPPLVKAVEWWLTASGIVTIAPHIAYLPRWLAVMTGLLLGWRIWIVLRALAVPPRWLLTPLMAMGIAGVLMEYRTLFGQEAGVALLALLMGGKLLELRSRRDGNVTLMLALFLLLTHYFNAETIAVGAWLLISLGVIVVTLMIAEAPALAPRDAGRRTGRLLVQSVPLLIILFLLFPRISGPLWGLPQDTRKATTGLSDTMSPGSISELIQSGALAFRVRFEDNVPPQHLLYWRGPVLSDFDGRNWRGLPAGGRVVREPARLEFTPNATESKYEITLEAHRQRWLLTLEQPTRIDTEHRIGRDLTALRRQALTERLRFQASAVFDYRAGRHELEDLLTRNRSLPAGNPRARALAAEWQAQGGSGTQIVERALAHFRRDAFFYTLQPPLLPETDGIDAFLFSTRRGFCEHYAGSFVFLMRAAGLPARVVTGYQGGEVNPVDGYLTVRQSDAHAWAEVWLAERGWIRIDPTAAVAPNRVERGLQSALAADEPVPAVMRSDLEWLRALRYRWEAVDNAWNQWVLGYNADRQRELLQRVGLPVDWQTLVAALLLAGGGVLLFLTAWLMHQRPARDPVLAAWQRLVGTLARRGFRIEPWEGPQRVVARVQTEAPTLAEPVIAAAHAFERLRYGEPRQNDLNTLIRCRRRLPRNQKST